MSVRGITFDVDGTLYSPRAVGLSFLWRARKHLRAFRVGRAVREELRARDFPDAASFLAEEARIAGERLELAPADARRAMDLAFDDALCAALARRGVDARVRRVLDDVVKRGIAIAAVSDRRVQGKLAALGLDDLPWAARLGADDHGALKPSPRPFLLACTAMNVAPAEAGHVGDRDKTDGAGARAAGLAFALVAGPGDLAQAVVRLVG